LSTLQNLKVWKNYDLQKKYAIDIDKNIASFKNLP